MLGVAELDFEATFRRSSQSMIPLLKLVVAWGPVEDSGVMVEMTSASGQTRDQIQLLLLLKQPSSYKINRLRTLNQYVRNPWLMLVGRVFARVDIPDEPGVDIILFGDYRAHDMIAALSLLRYAEGEVTRYRDSDLLASFLESQERTVVSYLITSLVLCMLCSTIACLIIYCRWGGRFWR